MHLQRTFQVAGFVLVHDIVLGQLVQHRSNLGRSASAALLSVVLRSAFTAFRAVLWKDGCVRAWLQSDEFSSRMTYGLP